MIDSTLNLAIACSVCFGSADGLQARGLTLGVLTLVLIITAVLALFAYFFVQLARRERRVLAKINNDPSHQKNQSRFYTEGA